MTQDTITQGLNDAQLSAVSAPLQPMLVLAGPGSGKTRVLTRRIVYMMQALGLKPYQILAVTFTNKAAAEMRKRITGLLQGVDGLSGLQIGTFHSVCARILRIEHDYTPYAPDFLIYDTDDQVKLVTQVLQEMNVDQKQFPPRSMLNAISNAKNELMLPHQYVANDYLGEIVQRVYPLYQKLLLFSNAMDFDDLLLQMVVTLRERDAVREKYQNRFVSVLVDEFQDTNTAQYQLVKLFGLPQNNIFAVGDEDQSIYAFRGADFRNVDRFKKDYPQAGVVLLEENYRSTQIVLDAAQAVINRNHHRTPKHLFTQKAGGAKLQVVEAYDEEAEGRYIVEQIQQLRSQSFKSYNDFAIMYRTNSQSRALETAMRRAMLPYTLIGGLGFFQRREVKDAIAYLRVINNPNDRVGFARVANTPKRGIGDRGIEQLFGWATVQNMSIAETLQHIVNGGKTSVNTRSAKAIAAFGAQLLRWRETATAGHLNELLGEVLLNIGFELYLAEISETKIQLNERKDNVNELRALLERADDDELPLADLLTDWSLMTDADTQSENTEAVRIMTLHAAKGLEYPVVFIAGVEDGFLPHFRSLEEQDGIEEERRLLYVGITRAEERLFLTYTFKRYTYSGSSERTPSPFLKDIPQALMDNPPLSLTAEQGSQAYKQSTTWDSTPKPSGLDRLRNDLAKSRPPEPPEPPKPKESYVPSPKFAGKIIPFPNGAMSQLKYRANMSVHHSVFGQGTVIQSALEDGEEVVTVAFTDRRYGVKQIMTSVAPLTILK